MSISRSDDSGSIHIHYSGGVYTHYIQVWEETVIDASGNTQTERRTEIFEMNDLPAGALVSFNSGRGHMNTHRDIKHPLT